MNKVLCVIGAGAMGTSMSVTLANNYEKIYLVGRKEKHMEDLNKQRVNEKYLPGVYIPHNIKPLIIEKLDFSKCNDIMLAIPSSGVKEFVDKYASDLEKINRLISVVKGLVGIETVYEYVSKNIDVNYISLMGPAYATQFARGFLTIFSAATNNKGFLSDFCNRLPNFIKCLIYENPIEIELAGVLKGVMALLAGYLEGIGLGKNFYAYALSIGINEIYKLGKALGIGDEVLLGPPFMGDFILTGFDNESRNKIQGLCLSKSGQRINVLSEGLNNIKRVILRSKNSGFRPRILEAFDRSLATGDPTDFLNAILYNIS